MTWLEGVVHLTLYPHREFKNFGAVAALYELVNPRFKRSTKQMSVMITPIVACGEEGYNQAFGFVLDSEMEEAKKELPQKGIKSSVKEIPEELTKMASDPTAPRKTINN